MNYDYLRMKNKRKNQTSEQRKLSRLQFEDAFQKFTLSSDGYVQVKDLETFLETLGLNQSETDDLLNQILTSLPKKDDSDSITLEELLSLLEQKFSIDGYINAADLMRISKELGQDITEQELTGMLDKVASNAQRDRVYKNDFKKLMEKLSLF
uniref:EF-hand domain-containing protein n=1 Tax=Ditylenchus dipsaci TaxID=166011 RepID=A0A915EG67_9BILA